MTALELYHSMRLLDPLAFFCCHGHKGNGNWVVEVVALAERKQLLLQLDTSSGEGGFSNVPVSCDYYLRSLM